MKTIIDKLYQRTNSIDIALQLYAGQLGIFNIYYGHRVNKYKKALWNRAKNYLTNKYAK